MKATDFNLPENLKFDFANGITSFGNSRLIILSSKAMGLLRHNIIKQVGVDNARKLLYKFGYQNGYTDFLEIRANYKFDTLNDLLASGPTIHTWEGIVQATPKEIKIDHLSKQFYFSGVWKNSYEAQQHLLYYEKGNLPVCWSLMGYAAGWCTAFWGNTILCVEPKCMGMGHENCEWELKPLADWDPKVIAPYLEAVLEGQEDMLESRES